jgi:hypothetical protein
MEETTNNKSLECIQFELATHSTDSDSPAITQTFAHTLVMALHHAGLTLPGMKDEPGSFSGNLDSAGPPGSPAPW